MEYLAVRKDEIFPFLTIWIALESITLSETSQMEKDKNHTISPMRDIKQKAINEQTNPTHKHRQENGGYRRGRDVEGGKAG